MTDSRLERIIIQLAELSEEEEQVLIDRIAEAREKRKTEKYYKLRDSFFDTARELEKSGYCLYWGDDRIDLNDLHFE